VLGGLRRRCRYGEHDIHRMLDQLSGEGGQPLVLPRGMALLNRKVLALYPALLTKYLSQFVEQGEYGRWLALSFRRRNIG
jgi:hypothetical protein